MSADKKPQPSPAAEGDQGEEMPFDPLLAQAERLPSSIRGSDGDKAHVLPVGDDGEAVLTEEDAIDEDIDSKPIDPKTFTADS